MSHYMTALAMKQSGLKPARKIVLYWLADHHNSETGACFPSLKKLAEECEMDKATVARHLAALEADGVILRRHRHRENGSQSSTEYTLNMQQPPVAKRDTPCRKTQQAPVANCAPHNLGINNLGNEPLSRDVVSVFDAYNETAERVGWPMVQSKSMAREQAAAKRIKECGGFENWRQAIERAAASDFLSGKATGTTPASFDWIHKPVNFTKIMEGNYDNKPTATQRQAPEGQPHRPDAALEQIARLAGLGQASGDGGA